MGRLKYIIQKEFIQVRRNKQMLPMIFIIPVIQLLVLVNAATFEVREINTTIIDKDKTESSRELIEKFSSTSRFRIVNYTESDKNAFDDIDEGKSRLILNIPNDFEKSLVNAGGPKIQFIINSLDGAAAGIVQTYAYTIVSEYNLNILKGLVAKSPGLLPSTIGINDRYWYNPELDYKLYMVPGILVILVTLIGMFLTSMNIVREKEIGTIEQLNVTPIRKREFIIGKLFPFWVIALFDLAFGLAIATLVYQIQILGNIFLIFGLAAVYLSVVLSVGLFISTISRTQQQSMFISFFFLMVFIMLSGLFTPIESMPDWAQVVAFLNPAAHFIEIMRRVILKGAGFWDVQTQFIVLVIYGIVMISLSTWRYRKTSD